MLNISDYGIGVPVNNRGEPDKDLLFRAFYRSNDAKQSESDGDGLGLFVCKMICDALDLYLDCKQKIISNYNIPLVKELLLRLKNWTSVDEVTLNRIKQDIRTHKEIEFKGKDEWSKLLYMDTETWKKHELTLYAEHSRCFYYTP